MVVKVFIVATFSLCLFALAAGVSYSVRYETIPNAEIVALQSELQALQDQAAELEAAANLKPVAQSWLAVQAMLEPYPDLVWQVTEYSDDAAAGQRRGWRAILVATPDLLLPLMHRIQQTVPAEVLEVQLSGQQSVLSIHILGTLIEESH